MFTFGHDRQRMLVAAGLGERIEDMPGRVDFIQRHDLFVSYDFVEQSTPSARPAMGKDNTPHKFSVKSALENPDILRDTVLCLKKFQYELQQMLVLFIAI